MLMGRMRGKSGQVKGQKEEIGEGEILGGLCGGMEAAVRFRAVSPPPARVARPAIVPGAARTPRPHRAVEGTAIGASI
jgi:hypothetical protein